MSVDGFVGGPNGELDWAFKSMGDDAALVEEITRLKREPGGELKPMDLRLVSMTPFASGTIAQVHRPA